MVNIQQYGSYNVTV